MSWNLDMPDTLYLSGESKHDDIQRMVNEVVDQPLVAIDTETTGLSKWADVPLYWSLAWGNSRATLRADTLRFFQDAFVKPKITWALANAKYDMHILGNYGFSIKGDWHDIQVMHALLYEDKPHKLKYIANHILGWTWADFEDQFGKIGAEQSAEEVIMRAERENFGLLVEYAANDAFGTLKCHEALKKQLEGEFTFSLFSNIAPYINTLWDFFEKIEAPYTKALWSMERRGIKINREKFASARPEAEAKIRNLEREIVKTAGFMLNPGSTPQLQKYFFDIAKLTPLSMTSGGKSGVRQPQVNEPFLEHYKHENKVASLLLEHRNYSKLLGTYILGLDSLVDPWDRIHTNFNQDVARCMPAGELVLTNRGYIPVEAVALGDYVISHTNTPRRVTERSAHPPQRIYSVVLDDGMRLQTTGNHKYLTNKGWKRADRLERDDEVVTHASGLEKWAIVPGWPDFKVSTWGRVYNAATLQPVELKQVGNRGYLAARISRDIGRVRYVRDALVHRMVLSAFRPGGSGPSVHLDGINWNNSLDNLHYVTHHKRDELPPFKTQRVAYVEMWDAAVTYGLTVAVDHSHVTGGIVTHNTGRLSSSDPNLQ